MIPPHEIEMVKAAADLPSIARQYITLKRSGDHHIAPCCFHSEKTPSLHIWNNRYSCFGCSAQGDVFTFLQQIEGWTLPQAVRYVADRYGIRLTLKRIPRALVALARESGQHCEWWWAQKFHQLEECHAAAWKEVEESGEGPHWNWLEYISGLAFRIRKLPSEERFRIFRAADPPASEWRAAIAEEQAAGESFAVLLGASISPEQRSILGRNI